MRSDSDEDSRRSVAGFPPGPLTGHLVIHESVALGAPPEIVHAATVKEGNATELLTTERGVLGLDRALRAPDNAKPPCRRGSSSLASAKKKSTK